MNMQTEIPPCHLAKVCPVKVAIARLMSDGRERTFWDIDSKVKAMPEAVQIAIDRMVRANLLTAVQASIGNEPIYRRAEPGLNGVTPRYAIKAALKKHQPISGIELSKKVEGMARSTLAAHLAKMEADGEVRRVGHSQYTKWEVAE